jgi:hypothetical protein
MKDLEKELIPYEQALELAKLNFNEKCFGYYGVENELYIEISCNLDTNLTRRNFIAAPTFSAAFRWFREKYKLVTWVYCSNEPNGYFAIILAHKRLVLYDAQFNTYEEAELACLNKLIEIVKKK